MNYDLICKLPNDLLHEMLDYHPLFYKYERQYYKMFIANNRIFNAILLSPNEYKELEKYNSNLTDILVRNCTITKVIIVKLVPKFKHNYHPLGGLEYTK